MNLAASCHLLNRPPLNRPPHVDIRKKSTPEPRVAVAGKNCKVPYMYIILQCQWAAANREEWERERRLLLWLAPLARAAGPAPTTLFQLAVRMTC